MMTLSLSAPWNVKFDAHINRIEMGMNILSVFRMEKTGIGPFWTGKRKRVTRQKEDSSDKMFGNKNFNSNI